MVVTSQKQQTRKEHGKEENEKMGEVAGIITQSKLCNN